MQNYRNCYAYTNCRKTKHKNQRLTLNKITIMTISNVFFVTNENIYEWLRQKHKKDISITFTKEAVCVSTLKNRCSFLHFIIISIRWGCPKCAVEFLYNGFECWTIFWFKTPTFFHYFVVPKRVRIMLFVSNLDKHSYFEEQKLRWLIMQKITPMLNIWLYRM